MWDVLWLSREMLVSSGDTWCPCSVKFNVCGRHHNTAALTTGGHLVLERCVCSNLDWGKHKVMLQNFIFNADWKIFPKVQVKVRVRESYGITSTNRDNFEVCRR